MAAGIAAQEASLGRRVLLAEIGDTSYFEDYFQLDPQTVGHAPRSSPLGFDLALWSGESCLHEYILHFLKVERLYRIFFENKVMRALLNVAPGLNEISILGKITSGVRHIGPAFGYDLVVVDGFATGHFTSLIKAPRGILEAVAIGPLAAQSRDIEAVLRNSEICGYVLVTQHEEMPALEAIEFYRELELLLRLKPTVIANKILKIPLGTDRLRHFRETSSASIDEFARYLLEVNERQQKYRGLFENSIGTIKCGNDQFEYNLPGSYTGIRS